MSEVVSKVYDIVYPSPISLEELSSIAVAIQLWRFDLNQRRLHNTLEEFCPHPDAEPKIMLRDIIPDTPSRINEIVGKFTRKLVLSTRGWLLYNYERIFSYHRETKNNILNDFDDIVCDYNGAISYVRTAERMLLCDRISLDEKFKIACEYCFEDRVRQMWPSVRDKFDLQKIRFLESPHLFYYWVCYLKHESNGTGYHISIDDHMLRLGTSKNKSSFEYFWNRASPAGKRRKTEDLTCARIFLPKLNRAQLAEFVSKKGFKLVSQSCGSFADAEHIFRMWMFIKDLMNEDNFTKLVEKMLGTETIYYHVSSVEDPDNQIACHKLSICCEIWNSARTILKRNAIRNILPHRFFHKHSLGSSKPRETLLLKTILADATLEEKKVFWSQDWFVFLTSVRCSDFDQLLKLCLENEEEITLFKTTTMADYETLRRMVTKCFDNGHVKELTHLLNLCLPDAQSNRKMKRRVLKDNFLGEHPISIRTIQESEALLQFINDAYSDDVELAAEFRNQLISSPGIMIGIEYGFYDSVIKLVESFASDEQVVDQVKQQFQNQLRQCLQLGRVWDGDTQYFRDFVLWCLGNDDQVVAFKQSLSPDQVLHAMVQKEIHVYGGNAKSRRFLRDIDIFSSWYFDADDKINQFKAQVAIEFDVQYKIATSNL